jgi:hypothetical protein
VLPENTTANLEKERIPERDLSSSFLSQYVVVPGRASGDGGQVGQRNATRRAQPYDAVTRPTDFSQVRRTCGRSYAASNAQRKRRRNSRPITFPFSVERFQYEFGLRLPSTWPTDFLARPLGEKRYLDQYY